MIGRAAADDVFIKDMTQEGVLKVLGGMSTFFGDSHFTTRAITVAVPITFTELRRARWRDVPLARLFEDTDIPLTTIHGPGVEWRRIVVRELEIGAVDHTLDVTNGT